MRYMIFKLKLFFIDFWLFFIYLDDDGDGVVDEDCVKFYLSMFFLNMKLKENKIMFVLFV